MKIAILSFLVSVVALAGNPTGNYKVIVDSLTKLESSHTSVTKIFSIGTNDDGTDIFAVRVSLTPENPDPRKVAHIVVATHHGDERRAPTTAMKFLQSLVDSYESHLVFRNGLADTEWTIVPVLNIPGYNARLREEHGWDPNRDYPGPCNASPGGHLKSIRTLMEHLKTRVYTGSITLHGYASSMTYPWGVALDDPHTLDDNAYTAVTSKAAEKNGYRYGTMAKVVYPARGTYEDFVYWKYGMWSLLIELASGSTTDIQQTVEAMTVWFDGIDRTPSTQNALNSHCREAGRLDLRNE